MGILSIISAIIWGLNKILWAAIIFVALLLLLVGSIGLVYILWTGLGKDILWTTEKKLPGKNSEKTHEEKEEFLRKVWELEV